MTVSTESGITFHASQVVVTVSIPILRNFIKFIPELSVAKTSALEITSFQNAMKIFLIFSASFWPSDVWSVVCPDCIVPEFGMHKETVRDSGEERFVVTSFVTAERTRDISNLTSEEIASKCLTLLDEIFATKDDKGPATRVYLNRCYVKSWLDDQNTRGGFSFPSSGGLDARRKMAESVSNCLYFAGEAMNLEFNTCVQGVMKSAGNAVNSIVASRSAALKSNK